MVLALLRQRLLGHKSEQADDPLTPQIALFNEAESAVESVEEAVEEEVVTPTKHRGKRNPLPADLARIEVIHELSEHALTCACRKHSMGWRGATRPHRLAKRAAFSGVYKPSYSE